MLRLVDGPLMGDEVHRSGWPYVMSALQPLLSADGLLFDDYVERTFLHPPLAMQSIRHQEPWVGFFHYPPDIPSWYAQILHLQNLERNEHWQASAPHLRLAICMAPNLQEWIRQTWQVPCVVTKLASETPPQTWDVQVYLSNPTKRLVQVGSFIRNTAAIYQLQGYPDFLTPTHLRQPIQVADNLHNICREWWQPDRAYDDRIDVWERLDNAAYDDLLAKNIVFIELLAACASNTVVECIARRTPIVVNRCEGVEFYLGKDYPLFYDTFESAADLLTHDRIIAAHQYLTAMDRSWLSGEVFKNTIETALRETVMS